MKTTEGKFNVGAMEAVDWRLVHFVKMSGVIIIVSLFRLAAHLPIRVDISSSAVLNAK